MSYSPIKRFWSLSKLYQQEVRQIYTLALFIGLVNLTLPLGIQAIINFLQTGELTITWLLLVGFVLMGLLISGWLQIMQLEVVEKSQQDLFARAGFEFSFRLPKISYMQLDKIHAPELVNRFFDIITIQKGVPKILIDFSLAFFQIVFGLLLLTIYSPYFIILAIVLAVILWLIIKLSGPRGLETSMKESKYKYNLANWLLEISKATRVFKFYNKSNFHLDKTDDIVSDYITARESHFQVLLGQFKLFVGFKIIVASALLVLGGLLVFNERMNLGQFVAAEIIILTIINSIEKIIRTVDVVYDVLTALEKIGFVTDLEFDKDYGDTELKPTTGLSVDVDNITFSFPSQRRNTLENISFHIASNEKVVLTGKSGSGKSTLLQLLSKIQMVQSGQIRINEVPIDNYKKDQFYQSLGTIFSENQIFEGTIKENILLGRSIESEQLEEVLRILNMNEYIRSQPKGINSPVDSGGRKLAQGIIQKIQIARLLMGEPRLLLLEEPLLFIEEDEKKVIVDYIMDANRPWTAIVVSDYYYWREKCSRIIDLS